MKYLGITFCMIITFVDLQAQKYILNESTAEVKDYNHFFVPTGKGKYIDILYATPHGAFSYNRNYENTIVTAYDQKLNQIYSKPIEAVKGKTYEGHIYLWGRLFLLFVNSKDNLFVYELNTENGSADLVNGLTEDEDKSTYIKTGVSPDSSHFFLLRINERNKESVYKGVVVNRDMKVVNRFSGTYEDKNIRSINYAVSNEGVFNILCVAGEISRKSEILPLKYTVIQFKAGKKNTGYLKDIPLGILSSMILKATGDSLYYTALLAKDRTSSYSSVISGIYNDAGNTTVKNDLPFSIPVNAGIVTVNNAEDKSTTIVLEAGTGDIYTAFSGWIPTPGSAGMSGTYYGGRSVVTITKANAFVIKLKDDHSVEWAKTISKYQYETKRQIYAGIIPLFDSNGGLSLFFHDARKNDQVENIKIATSVLPDKRKEVGLACVYINKNGKASKKFIDDAGNDSDYYFSPVNAVTEAGGKVVYSSYDYRNGGRSRYHIATITIK